MKRILTVLLILALILTAHAAMADDTDPVVGSWYIFFNFVDGTAPISIGIDYSVIVFTALEDGSVWSMEIDYTGENAEMIGPFKTDGWTNNAGKYTVCVVPGVSGAAYLQGSNLYVQLSDGTFYLAYRMRTLDWKYDIKNEIQLIAR